MSRQIIRTQAELDAFCVAVSEDKDVTLIAADTETEWLAEDAVTASGRWLPWQLDLYGTGIYAGKKHEAYIVHDPTFDYSCLDVLFHSYPLVFHNAPFDLHVMETHKLITQIDLMDVQDTKLMSHVENENKTSHSLKDLAGSVLHVKKEEIVRLGDVGAKPVKEEGTLFAGSAEAEKEYEDAVKAWELKLADYCMDDCKYTYKLYEKFKKLMDAESPDLWKVYSKLEVPFMRVLYDMQRRGIVLDKEYLNTLSAKVEDVLLDLGSKIYQEAGRQFDINSPKQLQAILIEKKITVPPEYVTPKGAVSTNVAAMTHLAGEGIKLAEYILKYRELTKLQSAFIQSLPKLAVKGIIHCNWNQGGTVTGRLSSSKPNLQQIPRRDDDLNIRKAFKPREGHVFVIADYSQVELRIMAYYSQDKRLLKTYQENGDIHAETAKLIGCERVVAKQINFGLNYGRTAYGLAKDKKLKLSVQDAEKFIARYFEQFPRVKQFMDRANNTVRTKKFVETITGRRRRFQGYNRLPMQKGSAQWEDLDLGAQKEILRERDSENRYMERQGCNAIIQGSASDLMKIAMRNMHAKLKPMGAHLLLQIHDEVVVECPKEIAEDVLKIVKHEMEHAVELDGVPLLADPKIADSWEK